MTKQLLTLATLTLSLSTALASSAGTACYSNPGQLTPHSESTYQSTTLCQQTCSEANHTVSAVHNSNACYCGSESQLPDPDDEVTGSDCSVPCPGWPQEDCGGPQTWTITITNPKTQSHLPPRSNKRNQFNNKINRRIDPSTESVIVTAPDTDDSGKPEGEDPLDDLSVNPTVVQTGIELPTSSAGAIDGFKTAPIPSDILTAPGSGETASSVSSAHGGDATSSMVVVPPGTTTTTSSSGGKATATGGSGAGSGSATSGGSGSMETGTGTTSGASSTASPSDGAAAGAVVPSGMVMLMSGLLALFW